MAKRKMVRAKRYSYTVKSLMKAAGKRRPPPRCQPEETDHIVEIQLAVAALNRLPASTYTRDDWQGDLVDFFSETSNLRCLSPKSNREKGRAVRKLIRSGEESLNENELESIDDITSTWEEIRDDLDELNFKRIKYAIDDILPEDKQP